jgi:uncharacterized repeat protein (TIGR01451 family)
MHPTSRIAATVSSLILVLCAASLLALPVAAQEKATAVNRGNVQVFVELYEPPTTQSWAATLKATGSRGSADAAGRAQRQRVLTEQGRFSTRMLAAKIDAKVIYQVEHVLNGFALDVDADQIDALRKVQGVKSVQIMEPEYPTNSTSVPFLQTPKVWENSIGLPQTYLGTGIRIAVIDTGVDYQHAQFNGTGLAADYTANNRTVAPDAFFPSAKVVDGFDFAGDLYTGSNAPVPDPDPMDCNGHGTHVAGTAAGVGVNTDNTPYAGPYTSAAPYGTLKIGPGTAPGAQLVAYRVFGCGGSTNLTVQAINRAMDPNNDTNLSDHVDVINMSLGSNFGTLSNTSSAASDNAALAGVIVVTSAGNAGETYFISGSPGAAQRAIATASSLDSGINTTVLIINSPGGIAGGYPAAAAQFTTPAPPPPPSGQTADVVIGLDAADVAGPLTTDGCSALTNAAAVAGKIVLLDRGTCGFQIKVKFAQQAGAIAAIISNNVPGDSTTLINMGSTAGEPQITIPSVFVATTTGDVIKANIAAPVNATMNLVPGSDTMSSFSSRGPRLASNGLKPDITAPGQAITSAQTGITCTGTAPSTGCQTPTAGGVIANSAPLTISGTSMASPHVAGVMALLKQIHPDWSVEELKALAMNGASHDLAFAPGGALWPMSRVGAGRVDPPNSAVNGSVAFNAGDAGAVSAAFFNEIVGTQSITKTIRVENKGTTSVTYDVGILNRADAPGVSFSLPGGSSLTLPAGESALVDVMLTGNSSTMTRTKEATISAVQAVTVPASLAFAIGRHYLTEESALLTFSVSGVEKMRVPLFSAARAASTMAGPTAIVTGGAPTGSTTIPLTGADVCTGVLGAGPVCTATHPQVQSLVSPFELQVVSPRNPALNPEHDLQYAGVAADATRIWFGLSTWGDWSSLQQTQFIVYIDNNLDGVYDRQIGHASTGNLSRTFFGGGAGQSDTDAHVVSVVQPPSSFFNTLAAGVPNLLNRLAPNTIDVPLYNTNVLFMGALPAQLGLANVNAPFRYKIETCPGNAPWCQQFFGFHNDEALGPFTWSGAARGLDFNNGSNLLPDLNGGSIPVTWNVANMTANNSRGALLLHHHNVAGRRTQIVPLDTALQTDLAVTAGSAPANPPLGSNITITVTLTNTGNPATAVTVSAPLPANITWISDDSTGTYNPATGQWTVAAMPVGTQTLNIVATVNTTDARTFLAQITANTPVDSNPANNQSSFTISAPRSGDLLATMTTSGATAMVGDPISYTITLKNNGIDPAYSIDVADSFPGFPAVSPATAIPSQGTFDMGTKTWNLAGLGSGITATLTLGLNAPNMAGTLTNSATATSTTADPNAGNNTASDGIVILSPSDVSGTKIAAGQFYIDGTVQYTITLNNTAAFDQQDNPTDEFVDVLPSTMTLVSANATSGTAVATIGTNTVTWNGAIPASGSVSIQVIATVNNTATPGATITNTGTIQYDADGEGTNEATRNVSVGFVVTSPAVITATKTVSGTFQPDTDVTYTIVLTSHGPATQLDNAGDEFTDTLPASLSIVSANATSGTASTVAQTVSWNGSIAPFATVTITIVAHIPAATPLSTSISNQGTANYDTDGNGSNETSTQTNDPGTAAPNDATTFTVSSPATVTATMTAAGSFQPDTDVTYTVVISNSGPGAQADNPGDEFVDTLPSSLTLVSVNATSGTATSSALRGVSTHAGETVHWNGSIPAGGSVTITIVAHIDPAIAGGTTISNQGTVNYDADGNGTNESSIQTNDPNTGASGDATAFVVSSPATIAGLTKDVSTRLARRGDPITYTVTFTNSGSPQADNPGDEFTDVLPAQLDLVSASATSGVAVANVGTNTVHWNGAIPTGGSVTITINAIVAFDATGGSVSNQGTLFFDADGNGTNESQAVTDDPDTPAADDPTVFAILDAQVPALSPLGLMLLSALLGGIALIVMRRMS